MFTRTVPAHIAQQQRPGKEQEPLNHHECKGDVTAGTSEIRRDKTRSQGTRAQMRYGSRPETPCPPHRVCPESRVFPKECKSRWRTSELKNPFRSSTDSEIEKRKHFTLFYELGQPGCPCSRLQRLRARGGQTPSRRAGAERGPRPDEASVRKASLAQN